MVTSIDFSCLIIPKWGYDLGIDSGNHNLGQMIAILMDSEYWPYTF
jgi:hypothetical protein